MSDRRAETTKIGGGAVYAKVAERLKLFREDYPDGKTETAYEVDVDGSIVFTVWLWKDKTDVMELMQSGITDKEVLRSSADANGTAKGQTGSKEKDFEKLESVATGRALAFLGYLASGEIASFEEMSEFNEYKQQRHEELVTETLERLGDINSLDELKTFWNDLGKLKADKRLVDAVKARNHQLTEAANAENTDSN